MSALLQAASWMPLPRKPPRSVREIQRAVSAFWKSTERALSVNPLNLYGLSYEDVELQTADGLKLAAWYVPVPAGENTRPAFLLHHHFGGQKASTLWWIKQLNSLGFPVLALDGRGHGASSAKPFRGAHFRTRALDVKAGVDYLSQRDGRAIIALGQSQGAAAVAMAASEDPRVLGLVFESGPAPESLIASWGFAGQLLGGGQPTTTRALLTARVVGMAQPLSYPINIWRALHGLRSRPVLWLHGTRDGVLPREVAGIWYKLLSKKARGAWRQLEVSGAEHVRCLQVDTLAVSRAVEELALDVERRASSMKAAAVG